MKSLRFEGGLSHILLIGAHCDDIEIGCGGSLLRLLSEHPRARVTWVVCASNPVREKEARACAAAFLRNRRSDVRVLGFRDGFLPAHWAELKDDFETLKKDVAPDLIFTHYRHDLHQDHRAVSELTWNTFRNHAILEYEIPKWDGDLGVPNVFIPIPAKILEGKITRVMRHYRTQAGKAWFTADLFRALPRLRGMECNSASGFAEAFYSRKISL
jgi:LmbE family N-acetylglucosaminyl deacetylase